MRASNNPPRLVVAVIKRLASQEDVGAIRGCLDDDGVNETHRSLDRGLVLGCQGGSETATGNSSPVLEKIYRKRALDSRRKSTPHDATQCTSSMMTRDAKDFVDSSESAPSQSSGQVRKSQRFDGRRRSICASSYQPCRLNCTRRLH